MPLSVVRPTLARGLLLAVGGAVVLLACGSSDSSATGRTATALTWHHDIRPIVEEKCQACHAVGSFAPFALTSYADAFAHKTEMAAAVSAGIMPPWPPNDAKNAYQHDRSLSDDARKMIVSWIAGGAPEGDATSYVPPASPPPLPLRVDKTLVPAAAYTPVDSPDEYRCFVMDWNETTTKYVTGLRVTPGAIGEVHHAIVFQILPADLDKLQQLDDADPGLGYRCFGTPGINSAGWIGAWAPGSLGSTFPPDTGIAVAPGSKMVVQMHYNTANANPSPDLSKIELQLADTVKTPAATLEWANPSWVTKHTMNIEPNDPDSVQTFKFAPSSLLSKITRNVLKDEQPFTIWTAALHMHTRGVKGVLDIVHANGDTETALEIDDWSFHWQGSYDLVKPIVVQPGDNISIECHFDNSGKRQPIIGGEPAPMGPVNWGETTEDEMCLGLFYVTP